MPSPDPKTALEVGARVYLREPTRRDGAQLIAANRLSRHIHRGWVLPPTDSAAFVRWIDRCRQPNVKCFLVCRLTDGAIVGVFILSQIVRGMFQSGYLGYYAEQPNVGEANVQPENAASIALVKRSGFRLEGFSPRYLKVGGRWRDHQRWAILIDDWLRLHRSPHAPSRYRARRSPPASSSRGRRRSG